VPRISGKEHIFKKEAWIRKETQEKKRDKENKTGGWRAFTRQKNKRERGNARREGEQDIKE